MTEEEAKDFARAFGETVSPKSTEEFGDEQIALRFAKNRGERYITVKGKGEHAGRFIVCELIPRKYSTHPKAR